MQRANTAVVGFVLLSAILCFSLANPSPLRVSYNELVTKLRQQNDIKCILNLLMWDKQVMQPPQGASGRAAQSATLSGVLHDMVVDESTANLIFAIQTMIQESQGAPLQIEEGLDEYELRNVELAQENYERSMRVPKDLVEKASKLSVTAFNQWVKARQANDFSIFASNMKEWIDLKIQIAKHARPGVPVYDVLLGEYERGSTENRIHELFAKVKIELVNLIKQIQQSEKYGMIDRSKLKSELYEQPKQEKLSKKLAEEVGYSFEAGRLDASTHPFTSSPGRSDVRITTRYSTDLMDSILPTLHEAGHGIYEQNLNAEYEGLPIANVMTQLATHESQSIFYERHIGKTEAYWKHYLPVLQSEFPNTPISNITVRELYEAINVVEPTFIRVTSDELTYPLHIILRFEIERGLFNGSITVDQIPEVWDAKMKEYLGIVPDNASLGCLQDVHWSIGYIGYFPDYLIGAMTAAQLAAKMPNLQQMLEQRDFQAIKDYLVTNVHSRGSFDRSSDDLLRHVTGEPLNPDYFIEYLRNKYFDIYNL